MASTGRYISPQDFGVLIADLRLAPTIFQDRLLEFLEQQRISARRSCPLAHCSCH